MKFTRINDSTVNCIITADDMDELGLTVEDLFQRKEDAIELLHEVIERAAQEVDYRPSGSYLPMQMTVLPDQSISLTLSENPNTAVADMLRGLAERLKTFLEEIAPRAAQEIAEAGGQQSPGEPQTATGNGRDRLKALPFTGKLRYTEVVFAFTSLEHVIRLAKAIGKTGVNSALYKDRSADRYLLWMEMGTESVPSFASLFMQANEYGAFVSADKRYILHMREAMECLVEEGALARLS